MPEMPEQDVQAVLEYGQPADLREDPQSDGASTEQDVYPDMLDDQDFQSGQTVPFAWETEADTHLFNEQVPAYSDSTYHDFDTSDEKGKGRDVEQQADAYGGQDAGAQYQGFQAVNQRAPLANSSSYQYQVTEPAYGYAPEHLYHSQPSYASLGYAHAGSEEDPSLTADPAFSTSHQARLFASRSTAAGPSSSRIIRRASKPATQSSAAPPKEKKPVKQSKKKILAQVRDSGSGLLWRPSPDQKWIPAVYHNDIWNELLDWTDQIAATQGGYDHPPAKGIEAWNRTAFCLAEKGWARDRGSRPGVLFHIQKVDVGIPLKPQDFFWNNRRVINRDNLGMRWFDDLPATISSAVEDFRLDAIQKLNPNIEWEDIWGRTPDEFKTGKEPGVRTRPALTVPALSNRTLRFRREAGTLAWDRKDDLGNQIALEFFQDLMGEECIKANNTHAFGRDLVPEEVDRLDEYLRVEKVPERAQARRLAGAATAAAQRQAQVGPSNSQHIQQVSSNHHNGQQPALPAQYQQASTQGAPQPPANNSAQSGSRQPIAQVGRTGQGSSWSRFAASRFRQGFSGYVQTPQTSSLANPSYGAPNNNGKHGFHVTKENRQPAPSAKTPRVNDSRSAMHQGQVVSSQHGRPQLHQPTPINPLNRSDVLPPNGMAGGAQMQASNNHAALTSANYAHLRGYANNASRKRVHAESDDEEWEVNGMQYKKRRVQQASAPQAPSARQVRRPAQRPWRPSQALSASVGAHSGTRAASGLLNGLQSKNRPTNESRNSGREPYAAAAASSTMKSAPKNGYMDITISVPIGSEVIVKPPNQRYKLVSMAIPGQNIEWKVVDREASAAPHDAENLMPSLEQEGGDLDWQAHKTSARSSVFMGNSHLPRTTNTAFDNNTADPTVEDSGPPPGLPEDFVEEGFEPDGYEDAVQYQDPPQTDNYNLSSSTLGAPLDYEAATCSPVFDNLAADPEVDYYSQFEIPDYSAEELDQVLTEAADNANAGSLNDPRAHAIQNLTETFALPQADMSGVPASGLTGLTYEQMQAEFENTFGRPLFDPHYPLENDIFGDSNYVEYPEDRPQVMAARIAEALEPSSSSEQARVVPDDGDNLGQATSSSPTQGAASGSPKAPHETPGTTIPSDPVSAPEVAIDSDPPATPEGSGPQEPDWNELFGEGYDDDVEEEL